MRMSVVMGWVWSRKVAGALGTNGGRGGWVRITVSRPLFCMTMDSFTTCFRVKFFSSFFLFSPLRERKFFMRVDRVRSCLSACYCRGTLSQQTNPRETFVKRLECKSAQMQRGEVFAVF